MHKAFRFLLGLVLALPLLAQPTREIGDVRVTAGDAIAISISGSTPELHSLARTAFNVHA